MDETVSQLVQQIVSELEQEQLKRIHKWDPEEVIKYAAHQMECFGQDFILMICSKCGLKEYDCLATFNRLLVRSDQIEYHNNPGLFFMPRIQREKHASWLKEQLGEEPEPEKVQVSQILHDLESEITDPNERMFYEETRLCLQAKAYRAVIVMGWNLVYEHLIRWIFSNTQRLNDFNTDLITRWVNKRKNTKYDAISDVEDFGNVKESVVIEVCRQSKLIVKEDFDMLDDALRKRNKFAHPKSKDVADSPIASGFVSELVRLMLRLT